MFVRARAFLVELRGDEPTAALSARLGYATDVVADWETGRTWPTAAEILRVCAARRIDVHGALRRFDPDSVHLYATGSDREVAAWLRAVIGPVDPRRVAKELGRPSATVRRWLAGQVRPTLPELLRLIETVTGRSEDLLQALLPRPTPVAATPSPASRRAATPERGRVAEALDQARRLRASVQSSRPAVPVDVEVDDEEDTVELFGTDLPTEEASRPEHLVWRAVASKDHTTLGPHRPGWLEARTGLSSDEVQSALDALAAGSHLAWTGDRWRAQDPPEDAIVALDPAARTPLERLADRRGAQITVSLSADDLARVRRLSRCTRAELTAIAASSARKDVLALVRVVA